MRSKQPSILLSCQRNLLNLPKFVHSIGLALSHIYTIAHPQGEAPLVTEAVLPETPARAMGSAAAKAHRDQGDGHRCPAPTRESRRLHDIPGESKLPLSSILGCFTFFIFTWSGSVVLVMTPAAASAGTPQPQLLKFPSVNSKSECVSRSSTQPTFGMFASQQKNTPPGGSAKRTGQ